MLFKLVIPYYNRQFHGGTIAKWHKAPGDWVEFGDDLLDLHVSEITVLRGSPDLKKDIRILTGPMVAQRMLQDESENLSTAQSPPPEMYMNVETEFAIRITASDMGKLRILLAPEGVSCRVGDTVAILSTEDDEPASDAPEVLNEASVFRVIPNPIVPLF